MDIKSKASITVTATLSMAEVMAALADNPVARTIVMDLAQSEVEKDPASLTFISRQVAFQEDGSASVEFVYATAEKSNTRAAPATAAPLADKPAPQAAQDDAAPPVPPAPSALPGIMIPSATA